MNLKEAMNIKDGIRAKLSDMNKRVDEIEETVIKLLAELAQAINDAQWNLFTNGHGNLTLECRNGSPAINKVVGGLDLEKYPLFGTTSQLVEDLGSYYIVGTEEEIVSFARRFTLNIKTTCLENQYQREHRENMNGIISFVRKCTT